jgi:hypothetical protein
VDQPDPVLNYARLPPKSQRNWIAIGIGIFLLVVPTFALLRLVTLLVVVPLVGGLAALVIGVIGYAPDKPHWRTFGTLAAIGLGLISVVGPCAMIAWADRSGPPIHFVIPTGFRGGFQLVVDRVNGVDVALRNGRYTYSIPASGVLRVRSLRPFEHWHTVSAAFPDGKPLPWSSQALPNDVMLEELWSGSRSGPQGEEEYLLLLVGTAADLQAAYQDHDVPLGHVEGN